MENNPITLPTEAEYSIHRHHRRLAWLIGILAFLFYGLVHTALPPVDGDAYEYAEVAHNFLETGSAVHTHLRYPALTDMELPVPAGRRLNLYTALCGVFEGLFGPGVLVILIPFLLGVLCLPRACLAALGPLFGAWPALLTSIMLLLHPRFLAVFVGDPNVEVLLTVLFLLAAASFYKERYLSFGVWVGLAFLIKVNGFVLALAGLATLLLCARDKLRSRPVVLGYGLALLLALPFVLRLAWNWSQGYPTSEGAMVPYLTLDWMRERSLIELVFRTATTTTQEPLNHGLLDMLSFSWVNFTKIIQGYSWAFMREAGVLEMSGYVVGLLSPLGFWFIRQRRHRVFTVVLALGFLAFHSLLIFGHEARFLMPVLPFVLAAGLSALQALLGEKAGLAVGQGFTLLMVVPALVVSLYIVGEEIVTGEGRQVYEELKHASEMIPDEHQTIVTVPFLSASYFTGRHTIPPPLEPMQDWLEQARRVKAQGLLLRRLGDGGCLPYHPNMRLHSETRHFCYYSLEGVLQPNQPEISEWSTYSPLEDALQVQHSDPYRSSIRFALDSATPVVYLGAVLGALVLMGGLAIWLPMWLTTFCVVLVSFGLSLFLVIDHDENTVKPVVRTIEESALAKAGYADVALSFEALALPEAAAPLSCALPAVVATCPAPLSNHRCDGAEGPVVIGCPNWSRPAPGTQEAEAITRLVGQALDEAAQRLDNQGLQVLRFERLVIGVPAPTEL